MTPAPKPDPGWVKDAEPGVQTSVVGLSPLGFDQLRAANVRRCQAVFHPVKEWSPTDWATAMAGECGETCNNVKKLRRLDGADKDENTAARRQELREKIALELADLVTYADLLAARLDIDLGEAVVRKFNLVSQRNGSSVRLSAELLELQVRDRARLDWLEGQTDGSSWVARQSITGRGFRLHNTGDVPLAVGAGTARGAIDAAMRAAMRAAQEEGR